MENFLINVPQVQRRKINQQKTVEAQVLNIVFSNNVIILI